MNNNLNLKIGDRVIRNYGNSLPTSIGIVVNITQKRGDYVVDYGNYKETYRYDGWQRGGDVWSRSHIRLLTPEDENGVGRTLTCIGFKPMDSEVIDKVAKKFHMYVGTKKCPVCGKENKYTRYSEWGFGTVELHYYCSRCTYFAEQCYSPVVEGISTDCPEEYLGRVRELGLDMYKPEEIPF